MPPTGSGRSPAAIATTSCRIRRSRSSRRLRYAGTGRRDPGDTLGTNGKEHGYIATVSAVTSSFYPAFSLSGDYMLAGRVRPVRRALLVSAEIQVRAPGIRAESCWDTEPQVSTSICTWRSVDGLAVRRPRAGAAPARIRTATTRTARPALRTGIRQRRTRRHAGLGLSDDGRVHQPAPRRDANGASGECERSADEPQALQRCFSTSLLRPGEHQHRRAGQRLEVRRGSEVLRRKRRLSLARERLLQRRARPIDATTPSPRTNSRSSRRPAATVG